MTERQSVSVSRRQTVSQTDRLELSATGAASEQIRVWTLVRQRWVLQKGLR